MTTRPKIGVIQFPGSNCERETAMALKRTGMAPIDIFWNSELDLLSNCDGYVIIGGFSYEDRLRSGVIASLNPIMMQLSHEINKAKPVLGICNGAQILMESCLVPGLKTKTLGGALYTNKRLISGKLVEGGYYNDWCDIKPLNLSASHAFTNQFKQEQTIRVPFAHAQGRFVLPEALLSEMKSTGASMFQYASQNPNGSVFDLAAISNKAGNVMAMMPHPERCEGGDVIFHSMREYILSTPFVDMNDSYMYSSPPTVIPKHKKDQKSMALLVELMIEDNTAKSLELVLKQHQFDVFVKRYQYWEIDSGEDVDTTLSALTETAELFNDSKEHVVDHPSKQTFSYLVRDKDDVLAKHKTKALQEFHGLSYIKGIKHGIVLAFSVTPDQMDSLKIYLKDTHLLYNPYVQDCYDYSTK